MNTNNKKMPEEFFLSDDEDMSSTITPQSISVVQRVTEWVGKSNNSLTNYYNTNSISDEEEYNPNNVKSLRSIVGKSKKSYKNNFLNFVYNIINMAYLIAVNGAFVIIILITKLLKWLKHFSREKKLWKIPFSFLTSLLERLYCFTGINKCRIQGTCHSLPNNDSVLNKCSWPLWVLGTCIISVFICGCYYSGPNASIKQKYDIGMEKMSYLYNLGLYNVYNLPGHDCMSQNNCCDSKLMSVKRWHYCLSTLPYRIALSGMKVEIVDMAALDESLQNLSDWRLRRSIYRIRTLFNELKTDVKVIDRKVDQTEQLLYSLKGLIQSNLSIVARLSLKEEELDLLYEDNSKRFEDVYGHLAILSKVKNNFENIVVEIKSGVKCSLQKMSKDIETSINKEMKVLDKFGNKIKLIDKKIHAKLGYNPYNKKIGMMRKEIQKIQKCLLTWRTKLSEFESYKTRFHSDMELLRQYTNDQYESEMARHAKANVDLKGKVSKIFVSLQTKLDQFFLQQKSLVNQYIINKYKFSGHNIFNAIMSEFCPKIKEFVKVTIMNTVTMSNSIKACGIFPSSSLPVDDHVNLCCFTKSWVLQQIDNTFDTFGADSIGMVDHALKENGGQILYEHSTPSLYVTIFEDNQVVSELNWPFLGRFMSHSQRLVNSISFLNSADQKPNNCWQFRGAKGSTIIKLAFLVNITMITIDHIYPEISLSKNFNDALKDFDVIALQSPGDLKESIIGTFVFKDIIHFPIQQFVLLNPTATQYLKFVVNSNHGADVTCVYRIRIHGNVLP